jgi:tRNA wybutosine-synthesizing protein 1
VPYFKEVMDFAKLFCSKIENYEIAVVHVHSMFVLIAHKKYKINGKWNTWINYDKFAKLVNSNEDFDELDYCSETPEVNLFFNN